MADRKAKKPQAPQTPEACIAERLRRVENRAAIRAFFIKLLVITAALWAVFSFVFGIAAARGEGMYPRIRDGDLLLYYRLPQEYYIGDVVTFTAQDGTRQTGRIVARGGDVVDITPEGELLVNGNVQTEEIFYPTTQDAAAVSFPYTVQQGSVFLLGDMRKTATDSRQYGAVEENSLDGKVIAILRRRGL